MGLQDVVRWFLPKEDHFYDYLERLAVVAHEASNALSSFAEPGTDVQKIRERVQEIEHTADAIVHELEEALAKTFVTPIDREDLQSLASELDSVIDYLNGAARGAALFGVDRPTPAMHSLMKGICACTAVLKEAVPRLRAHDYAGLIEKTREIRKIEKDGDLCYRKAVSDLFRDAAIDAKELLRQKAVLDDLEEALDTCEDVGEALANLAVKNG